MQFLQSGRQHLVALHQLQPQLCPYDGNVQPQLYNFWNKGLNKPFSLANLGAQPPSTYVKLPLSLCIIFFQKTVIPILRATDFCAIIRSASREVWCVMELPTVLITQTQMKPNVAVCVSTIFLMLFLVFFKALCFLVCFCADKMRCDSARLFSKMKRKLRTHDLCDFCINFTQNYYFTASIDELYRRFNKKNY